LPPLYDPSIDSNGKITTNSSAIYVSGIINEIIALARDLLTNLKPNQQDLLDYCDGFSTLGFLLQRLYPKLNTRTVEMLDSLMSSITNGLII
jgi:hypothetical protein